MDNKLDYSQYIIGLFNFLSTLITPSLNLEKNELKYHNSMTDRL